jgi:hypothetical protein
MITAVLQKHYYFFVVLILASVNIAKYFLNFKWEYVRINAFEFLFRFVLNLIRHSPTILWKKNNVFNVAFDLCAALTSALRRFFQPFAEGELGFIFFREHRSAPPQACPGNKCASLLVFRLYLLDMYHNGGLSINQSISLHRKISFNFCD